MNADRLFGSTPKHWQRLKVKYLVSLQSGDAIGTEAINDTGEYPVYGGNGLRGYTSDFTHEGERILIGRQGALCGNVNYASGKFWATEHAIVATPRREFDTKWLGESLRAMNLNQHSQSAAQPGIAIEVVENLDIAVPPISEQRIIARSLTKETDRIDLLIEEKQRLILLLGEKRRALIASAITQGLNPDTPRRDSGIPWLGEIPTHWVVWRIGHFAAVGNGSTPFRDNLDYWSAGTIPWLNSAATNDAEITDAKQFVTSAAVAECHLPLVSAGSVLVAITGQGKTRGQAALLTFPATINQHIAYITPGAGVVSADFLRLWFVAKYDFLRAMSDDMGGTKGALSCEQITNLRIAAPPVEEQLTISAHIKTETKKIDDFAKATEHTIKLLQERRSALISAAVTGQLKIDVSASEVVPA